VTQFHHICFFCAQRGIVEKLEHGALLIVVFVSVQDLRG
jgi:hypothetical protein